MTSRGPFRPKTFYDSMITCYMSYLGAPQPKCSWSDVDFVHINQPNIINCVICFADLNHMKIMTQICLRSCKNDLFSLVFSEI